jgi:hypothetical protein
MNPKSRKEIYMIYFCGDNKKKPTNKIFKYMIGKIQTIRRERKRLWKDSRTVVTGLRSTNQWVTRYSEMKKELEISN